MQPTLKCKGKGGAGISKVIKETPHRAQELEDIWCLCPDLGGFISLRFQLHTHPGELRKKTGITAIKEPVMWVLILWWFSRIGEVGDVVERALGCKFEGQGSMHYWPCDPGQF